MSPADTSYPHRVSVSGSPDLPAILVDDVSKSFALPTEQVHTIKERVLHPLRRPGEEVLQALRNVSFDVKKGEFFGIVGRNGSGKSTLLKCLAGIYRRDEGDIYVNGRMSAFIELGVGFNLDLAAIDNILLNATMLGLSTKEARRRVDAILDFAELREFAELKVKNYSSGMLVRLAFSVMIQVDAEVLLIDEVLAVGDANFQQKCHAEFERIRRSNKTVLLVTHDMSAVRRFCDRAMLLEKGRLAAIGEPQDVGNRYLQLNFSEEARAIEKAAADQAAMTGHHTPVAFMGEEGETFGDGGATIAEAWFEDADGVPQLTLENGRPYTFCMRVRFDREVVDPLFSTSMTNLQGLQLFSASSVWTDPTPGTFRAGDTTLFRVAFDNILSAGRYSITAAVTLADGTWLQLRERMFGVMVTSTRTSGALVDVPSVATLRREGAAEGATR
jgi:ABC-type polysaccharide/polyol phosphate transport system ATPase subunit